MKLPINQPNLNNSKPHVHVILTVKGFTLIELMVVVAIIAIISVVAVALFANANQRARDGKRVAELESVVNALEVNKQTTYLALAPTQFAGGAIPNLDPGGTNVYCINRNGGVDAVPANFTGGVCNGVGGTAGYTTLPAYVASVLYKLCTLREITTPLIFCRTNLQ